MENTAVRKRYWGKTLISFLLVLCAMPLGHAMMILMEHFLPQEALHGSAFALGAVGLAIVIIGVFAKGDTKQTILGLAGGLLFWTGWVEFLLQYYASRYGVQPEIVNGEIVTKPEYLIMPATFGFWMLIMTVYIFSVKTGCLFINWIQKRIFGRRKDEIVTRPLSRHTSITTFMELNMMMWACYLLLMFCYDPEFLGDRHPVTLIIGAGCLIGAIFMFIKELGIASWGANIRMAIATVIVFWTPVEIMGRNDLFNEIWVAPTEHVTEMAIILAAFLILAACLACNLVRKRKQETKKPEAKGQ
ncbi:MAG TPA: hypothetical protein IAC34_06865 [Candidatus Coprenecus stercoripullorum]|nr:hypothetical protein [Candidatus Coprenecus stercoripullorum]